MHGIAVLSIAVLLGSTSAVPGGQVPWVVVVRNTREIYGFNLGAVSPIEYSNFDNPIEFSYTRLHDHHMYTDNVLVVMETDQSLPQITVGGKSYKLYAFVLRLIDFYNGMAALVVIFNVDRKYRYDKSAALYIPISLSETGENLSEPLNGDLFAFSNFPSWRKWRTHTFTSVQWLKPLMEKAKLATRFGPDSRIKYRDYFQMGSDYFELPKISYFIDTDCVTVSKDSVKGFK